MIFPEASTVNVELWESCFEGLNRSIATEVAPFHSSRCTEAVCSLSLKSAFALRLRHERRRPLLSSSY